MKDKGFIGQIRSSRISKMVSMIEKFENAFRRLSINRGNQHVKEPAPHQPCLLLAVIEAIEQGTITENAIHYEPRLLEHFDRYSNIVKSQKAGKKRKAHYPFVFLDAKDFWNLHLMPGRPKLDTWQARNKLGSSSHHRVEEDTDFVELDPELYVCLRDDPTARQRLRAALIDKWLSSHKKELWAAIRSARAWAFDHKYGYDTINPNDPPAAVDKPQTRWQKINPDRDPRFRDIVLSAYGYRCAATGWRFKTAGQAEKLLEAAHIIPLKENPDNRPQNGMALTPTVHKAMDARLIAPGPDLRWHASSTIRKAAKRDSGTRWLADLDQQPILLPPESYLRPTRSVLEWRMEHLE